MIDNPRRQTWTVYGYRADTAATGFVVTATRWNEDGPVGEDVLRNYETEAEARGTAEAAQIEYDRLRGILIDSARENRDGSSNE